MHKLSLILILLTGHLSNLESAEINSFTLADPTPTNSLWFGKKVFELQNGMFLVAESHLSREKKQHEFYAREFHLFHWPNILVKSFGNPSAPVNTKWINHYWKFLGQLGNDNLLFTKPCGDYRCLTTVDFQTGKVYSEVYFGRVDVNDINLSIGDKGLIKSDNNYTGLYDALSEGKGYERLKKVHFLKNGRVLVGTSVSKSYGMYHRVQLLRVYLLGPQGKLIKRFDYYGKIYNQYSWEKFDLINFFEFKDNRAAWSIPSHIVKMFAEGSGSVTSINTLTGNIQNTLIGKRWFLGTKAKVLNSNLLHIGSEVGGQYYLVNPLNLEIKKFDEFTIERINTKTGKIEKFPCHTEVHYLPSGDYYYKHERSNGTCSHFSIRSGNDGSVLNHPKIDYPAHWIKNVWQIKGKTYAFIGKGGKPHCFVGYKSSPREFWRHCFPQKYSAKAFRFGDNLFYHREVEGVKFLYKIDTQTHQIELLGSNYRLMFWEERMLMGQRVKHDGPYFWKLFGPDQKLNDLSDDSFPWNHKRVVKNIESDKLYWIKQLSCDSPPCETTLMEMDFTKGPSSKRPLKLCGQPLWAYDGETPRYSDKNSVLPVVMKQNAQGQQFINFIELQSMKLLAKKELRKVTSYSPLRQFPNSFLVWDSPNKKDSKLQIYQFSQ